ncbi:MAG: hypothetical protein IKR17_08890 [Bacteroidales bacterium]|nr:hypothetical protein [Bacteroidales bacterium]
MTIEQEQALVKLRNQLEREKWPQKYAFKFIMPNDGFTIKQVEMVLPTDGQRSARLSKNGKYLALTHICMAPAAEMVTRVTGMAMEVPGVMTL